MKQVEAEWLDMLLKKLAAEGEVARRRLQSVKTISYEELCRAIALLEELH